MLEEAKETPAVRLIHGELGLREESRHRIFIALFIHPTQMYCVSIGSGIVLHQALVCSSAVEADIVLAPRKLTVWWARQTLNK